MSARRPCVFFDRDGIVNRDPHPARYVTRREEFVLLPGFVAALRAARERGYPAVVVTNQKGIALGLVPMEEVEAMHRDLCGRLRAEGLELLDILVAPFAGDAHPWRKPNPGMLLAAAERHGLDLTRSWMIGDSERDVTAGRRAGCRTVRVAPVAGPSAADFRVPDVDALAAFLRVHLPDLSDR